MCIAPTPGRRGILYIRCSNEVIVAGSMSGFDCFNGLVALSALGSRR
jgi:hypothetical protein